MLAFSIFRRAKMFGYDWGITLFGLSALGVTGAIGFYKLRYDAVNEHPAVLKAIDLIVESGMFRKEECVKDWPVMGRTQDSRAKLSFNLITPQGNGKVQVVSHEAVSPTGGVVWDTDSLVIDFMDTKARLVFDVTSQKWFKEPTPAGAIQFTDVLLSGTKKVYGPMMDYTLASVTNHPFRYLAGLGVSAVAFRYRRFVFGDPFFSHVRNQLHSHKEIAKFVGEPIKVSFGMDGKIAAPIANFAIDVSGPAARGKVHVQAYKDDGTWKISFSKLRLDGSSKTHPINLSG